MPHGLVGDGTKTFGCNGGIAHNEHAACITVPTVFDDGDVDVDNIAFLSTFVIGNAVANLMVDGGANGLRVGRVARRLVIEGGWNGALNLNHVIMGQLVQFVGGDAWFYKGR
jgi:hypothetical protein